MTRAFRILGSQGIADPGNLSAAIGEALVSTAAGLIACPIGLALLIPCIVVLARDARKLQISSEGNRG